MSITKIKVSQSYREQYSELLDDVKNAIWNIMSEKQEVSLGDDCYLGEWRAEVSGYDKMNKIIFNEGEVIVEGDLQNYLLVDMSLLDIIHILQTIEE